MDVLLRSAPHRGVNKWMGMWWAWVVSGIPSVWLILNTRSLRSIRVLSKPRRFLTWAQPGVCNICHYARSICQRKAARVWCLKKKAFWMNVCVWACALRKCRKILMHEAHCGMFPKHWETCALNIEESSGTVYLPATSHRFQISSNNLTCHFMVWYFCETWKPQSPNPSDAHKTI